MNFDKRKQAQSKCPFCKAVLEPAKFEHMTFKGYGDEMEILEPQGYVHKTPLEKPATILYPDMPKLMDKILKKG